MPIISSSLFSAGSEGITEVYEFDCFREQYSESGLLNHYRLKASRFTARTPNRRLGNQLTRLYSSAYIILLTFIAFLLF